MAQTTHDAQHVDLTGGGELDFQQNLTLELQRPRFIRICGDWFRDHDGNVDRVRPECRLGRW